MAVERVSQKMQESEISAQSGGTVGIRLKRVLDANKWTDIKFQVGSPANTETIAAHRLVMAAASPAFEAMCFGSLAEGDQLVKVPDVSPRAFKVMLQHLYTDTVQLQSVEIACEVLQIARKYMVPELMSKSKAYLLKNLSAANACLVLESCMEDYLLKESLDRIRHSTDEVLQQAGFPHVTWDTLKLILEQDSLNITSEASLIDASVRWAEERCKEAGLDPTRENLRSALGLTLSKIRFLTLTAEQLVRSPGFEKLLTDEEARKILTNIAKPNSCQLPDSICSSDKRRSSPTHAPFAKRAMNNKRSSAFGAVYSSSDNYFGR